jgi:hypothetical protein
MCVRMRQQLSHHAWITQPLCDALHRFQQGSTPDALAADACTATMPQLLHAAMPLHCAPSAGSWTPPTTSQASASTSR